MNRSLRKMMKEFRAHWKSYVLQSALASVVVFVLLWWLRAENLLIVASLGSTAFIVFAMPRSLTAQPRNVIGGQLSGLGCGALASALVSLLAAHSLVGQAGIYSLCIGLSIFVMVVSDTEHPPASGTALGIAIRGVSLNATLAVVAGAILLSLVHQLAHHKMRDLA
jgi:CBS-domain-containing membrane protein